LREGKVMDRKKSIKILLQTRKLRVYSMLVFLSLATGACIEEFTADIDEQIKILTVEGSLIKGDETQSVVISYSTTLVYQQFLPVLGCDVKVVDEFNNEFPYLEQDDGTYKATIDNELLIDGREYKLTVRTASGAEYESEYEILNSSPVIDSVYYEIEDRIENYSGEDITGLQFYIDVKAADTTSRYYRWKLIDTYEYTAKAGISYYYYMWDYVRMSPKSTYGVYRCWLSEDVPGMYLTNTNNLILNEKKQIPLHYVSNRTDRLKIRYSLVVEQYSLTEEAHNYFQQKKIASEDPGGLYTRQPSQAVTNIRAKSDTDEKALGYFWASAKTQKRLMVPKLAIPILDQGCTLKPFDINVYEPFPIYIWVDDETGIPMTGNANCFICTLREGTITKPDYWD
jgi:hypothetical protein